MAGLRSGAFGNIKFRCSECNKNPKLMKVWGHEEKTQIPGGVLTEIDGEIERVFWNCPIRFIPSSITRVGGFLDLYEHHHEDFPSAPMPSYKNTSVRFLAACRYLKSKISEYTLNSLKE